jgi:hypothetical protein
MGVFLHGQKGDKDKSEGLTARASDILKGRTALVNGEILTGSLTTANILSPIVESGIIYETSDATGGLSKEITLATGVDYLIFGHFGGYFSAIYSNARYVGKVIDGVLTEIVASNASGSKSGNKVTVTLNSSVRGSYMVCAIPIKFN